MKRAVIRALREAELHCPHCGLTANAALLGEREAATARQVWRHGVCGHVLMYRPAINFGLGADVAVKQIRKRERAQRTRGGSP